MGYPNNWMVLFKPICPWGVFTFDPFPNEGFHSHGGYPQLDGWFHGKSQSKMENLGVPLWLTKAQKKTCIIYIYNGKCMKIVRLTKKHGCSKRELRISPCWDRDENSPCAVSIIISGVKWRSNGDINQERWAIFQSWYSMFNGCWKLLCIMSNYSGYLMRDIVEIQPDIVGYSGARQCGNIILYGGI